MRRQFRLHVRIVDSIGKDTAFRLIPTSIPIKIARGDAIGR